MTQQGGNQQAGTLVVPPAQDFISAALQGSIQQILAENLGRYVDCEFLVGSDSTATKSGLLRYVGASYIVLYDEATRNNIIGDAYSLKFVTLYPAPEPVPEATSPEAAPPEPQAPPPQAQQNTTQTAPSPTTQTPITQVPGLQQVSSNRAQAQAAFNYAKRKARR